MFIHKSFKPDKQGGLGYEQQFIKSEPLSPWKEKWFLLRARAALSC